MRIIWPAILVLAVALAACSEAKRTEEASARFGCLPVDGVNQLNGPKAASYVLVGEFTETNEAPATFAEIACHVAAGLPPYLTMRAV